MNSSIIAFATATAAIGTGLVSGIFYAFSTFVMRALGRLAPAEGVRAMQAINVTVLSPLFLGVFVGTAVLCGALALGAIASWGTPGSAWRLAGAVLYVVGTFGVTMAFNVPRNHVLASLDGEARAAEPVWQTYLDEWTRWNHVRPAAAVAAAAMLLAAAGSRP